MPLLRTGLGRGLAALQLGDPDIELAHVVFELQTMGIMPLLAHPERYHWLHRHPDVLGELVAKGVRAQVTAASLTGRAGREQQALAQ